MTLVLATTGCQSCQDSPTPASSSPAVPATIPTPRGVLAEIHVRHPEQAWAQTQPLLTRVLGFKPVSLSASLTDLFAIPAAYSPQIAVDKPILGVLVDGDPPRGVVGIQMRSGRELVAALTTGQDPTHHAQVEGGDLVLLEPQRRAPVGGWALGVCANALLIAAARDDLVRYGPFVARELPKNASLGIDDGVPAGSYSFLVKQPALTGLMVARLRAWWNTSRERLEHQLLEQRQRRDGRPPDFAEPEAAIDAVDRIIRYGLGLAGSAESFSLALEPSSDSIGVSARLRASRGGALKELVGSFGAGAATSLLALPKETQIGVGIHSSREGRQALARETSARLGALFGARLSPADEHALSETLDATARGLADDLSVGVLATREGLALVAGGTVSDARSLDGGVRGLIMATRFSAFAEPLATFFGAPHLSIDQVAIEGVETPVSRGRWNSVGPGTGVSTPSQVLWVVERGRLHAAGGKAAESALCALVKSASDSTGLLSVGDNEPLASALKQSGSSIMTIFVRPEALDWAQLGPAARPLVLALGTDRKRNLDLHLELDHSTLLSLVRTPSGTRSLVGQSE